MHLNNDAGSSLDSALLRIENEKAASGTGVQIENSGTASSKWDIIVPGSSTDLRIKGNGSDHVTIQNDGDVGIGTSSPTVTLDVDGDAIFNESGAAKDFRIESDANTHQFYVDGTNNEIGVNTSTPASTIDIQGSMGLKVNTITSATTLDQTHNVVLCNTGAYTVTLPPAASNTGRVYSIKNIDSDCDDITIDGNSTETIDGSETYVLDSYNNVVRIISDGSNWFIINENTVACTAFTGSITGTLTCVSSTDYGTLQVSVAASGVSSTIPYTGGNGGTHSGQTVTSTGVTGLTATLSSGTFASGAGTLTYTITGTPSGSGTASFSINIGGETCTLDRTVDAAVPNCGTVTFTYNGASVTYGTVLSSTGECWLDRNLGATRVAESSTDHLAYGDLFQWGRADDGHQLITWTNSTTGTAVNGTTSNNVDNPANALFITGTSLNDDWRVNPDDNLWNGESASNNPCPSGWRVPTETEWSAEITSENITNSSSAYSSVLKLLPAGVREYNSGLLNASGSSGRYWSSTVSGTTVNQFNFWSTNLTSTAVYMGRVNALSIRCIKD